MDGVIEDGESIDTKPKTTEIDTSSTPVEEIDNDEIIGKNLISVLFLLSYPFEIHKNLLAMLFCFLIVVSTK